MRTAEHVEQRPSLQEAGFIEAQPDATALCMLYVKKIINAASLPNGDVESNKSSPLETKGMKVIWGSAGSNGDLHPTVTFTDSNSTTTFHFEPPTPNHEIKVDSTLILKTVTYNNGSGEGELHWDLSQANGTSQTRPADHSLLSKLEGLADRLSSVIPDSLAPENNGHELNGKTHLPQNGTSPNNAKHDYRRDPQLVQACLNGDQQAWDKLISRYGQLVYSIPGRLGLSTQDADDVFQNAFTILFNGLASLRNQTCLAAWLITTTYRECWRLSKQTPSQLPLENDLQDDKPPMEETAIEMDQRNSESRAVRMALKKLTEAAPKTGINQQPAFLNKTERALLNILFFAPKLPPSYAEIGARLGLAEGSIGPIRDRALKKVKKRLFEQGFNPSAFGFISYQK